MAHLLKYVNGSFSISDVQIDSESKAYRSQSLYRMTDMSRGFLTLRDGF